MRARMQSLGAVGLAALCLSTASADIALLGDGSRVTGQLTAAEGRLRFLQSDKALASRPQLIQFNPTVSERLDRFQQRVWFDDGQHFSGSLEKVGPKAIVLQVAPSVVRSIPRDEVRAISRASAHRPVLGDDFEQASKYWQLAGGAARSKEQAANGDWALKLGRPGQSATLALPEPVSAGRVDLSFRVDGTPRDAAWQLHATFGDGEAAKTVTVLLAGTAESSAEAVPAEAGWHRLSLRFHDAYLLVGLERQVVWSSPDRRRFGALRKLSLVCTAAGEEAGAAVFVDDVAIARSAAAFRPTPGIVSADTLRLPSGDQLFGTLAGANRGTIDFRGKFESSEFSWEEVAGVELHAEAVPTHRTSGEHARIRFFGSDPSEPDELQGVVAALDGKALTLEHAVLGKVTIERKRLVSIRPLFHGVRVELGHEARHLGEAGTKTPGVRTAAEGRSLKKSFKLEAAPREVTLVLSVAHPDPTDGPRTDILLNGAKVEAIERHVRPAAGSEDSRRAPPPFGYRRVRISLPADALRVGDNVLELRLSPPPEGERPGRCLVRELVLELSK